MRVRPLLPEEAEALGRLKSAEWPKTDQAHFGTLDLDFEKHPFTLVAEEDGDLAGYVTATLDMGALYVDGVLVAEAHRGTGLGRRLMEACERTGKEMGAHKVWLETGADWDARHLYERLGYQQTAVLKEHYARQDFLLYEKFL